VFQPHDYQGWSTLTTVYEWIRGEMQKNNCVKPIQVWELAYGLDLNKTLDLEVQARSDVKMLTISANEGAEMINYFPLQESLYLGRKFRALYKDLNRRPAATAYQTTTAKLSGVTAAI
jgi:hypothetical protein